MFQLFRKKNIVKTLIIFSVISLFIAGVAIVNAAVVAYSDLGNARDLVYDQLNYTRMSQEGDGTENCNQFPGWVNSISPLAFNDDLADAAQNYAESRALGGSGDMDLGLYGDASYFISSNLDYAKDIDGRPNSNKDGVLTILEIQDLFSDFSQTPMSYCNMLDDRSNEVGIGIAKNTDEADVTSYFYVLAFARKTGFTPLVVSVYDYDFDNPVDPYEQVNDGNDYTHTFTIYNTGNDVAILSASAINIIGTDAINFSIIENPTTGGFVNCNSSIISPNPGFSSYCHVTVSAPSGSTTELKNAGLSIEYTNPAQNFTINLTGNGQYEGPDVNTFQMSHDKSDIDVGNWIYNNTLTSTFDYSIDSVNDSLIYLSTDSGATYNLVVGTIEIDALDSTKLITTFDDSVIGGLNVGLTGTQNILKFEEGALTHMREDGIPVMNEEIIKPISLLPIARFDGVSAVSYLKAEMVAYAPTATVQQFINQSDAFTKEVATYLVTSKDLNKIFVSDFIAIDINSVAQDIYEEGTNSLIQVFVNDSREVGINTAYTWNFGDGVTSNQNSVIHQYLTFNDYDDVNDNYAVSLIAENADTLVDTFNQDLRIIEPPRVNFSVSTPKGTTDSVITFTGITERIPVGAIYYWDFGDTTSAVGEVVTHQYAVDGTYTVTLQVTDSITGRIYTAEKKDFIVISTPFVDFESLETGDVLKRVQFTDISDTAGATSVSYSWNFGDASSATNISTLQNPSHVYTDMGNYNVILTVTTEYGAKSFTKEINVSPVLKMNDLMLLESENNDDGTFKTALQVAKPETLATVTLARDDGTLGDAQEVYRFYYNNKVDFGATHTSGSLQVNFTNSSYYSDVASYSWDFGDGSNSSLENPSHTYLVEGIHSVVLELNLDDGTLYSETKIISLTSLGMDLDTKEFYKYDTAFTDYRIEDSGFPYVSISKDDLFTRTISGQNYEVAEFDVNFNPKHYYFTMMSVTSGTVYYSKMSNLNWVYGDIADLETYKTANEISEIDFESWFYDAIRTNSYRNNNSSYPILSTLLIDVASNDDFDIPNEVSTPDGQVTIEDVERLWLKSSYPNSFPLYEFHQ